ncbi:Cytochrome c oxidase subunit 2 precursor [Blastopirellula retiformator]|uniref:Cytochrome c oxidase subunit 2 n=2 Tax=Blastopirellula retiformator TaxID=2527970 RepID=A0A5C5VAD8_9BACT|nr:Cytochrome c oxidase subunit 2 precursor [Blastopirellula retiformator]
MMNLLSTLSLLAEAGSLFFTPSNSVFAPEVDNLFDLIYWISAFFFVLIVAVMVYFVVMYRRRPGHSVQPSPSHNNVLEITWSVLPSFLLVLIFVMGFTGYMNIRTPPDDAYEIHVYAKKWSWLFQYPNGAESSDLHIPVGRPVRFILESEDVIHNMFVPAFRTKMDCVPGRYNEIWVLADHSTGTGIKDEDHEPTWLFCAEYCGRDHSNMKAKVFVHETGDFDAWVAKAANLYEGRTMAEVGELLYKRKGCISCHSIDGTRKSGPSFKGGFGTAHKMADGSEVVMDENYIRESIRDPRAKVVAGYEPVMPVFPSSRLSDKDITAISEFIKSLK